MTMVWKGGRFDTPRGHARHARACERRAVEAAERAARAAEIDRAIAEERAAAEAAHRARGVVAERCASIYAGGVEKWRARVDIVDGVDAAATWAIAIFGTCDEDTVQCIARDGVDGADAARARWRKQVDAVRAQPEGAS